MYGRLHLLTSLQARTSCPPVLSMVGNCCRSENFQQDLFAFSSATSTNPSKWVSWLPVQAYAQVWFWRDGLQIQPWLTSLKIDTTQGYLRYKFSSLSPLLPCLGRIFTWLIGDQTTKPLKPWILTIEPPASIKIPGDPRVPATRNAAPVSTSAPLTPIIFSHGLA